MRESFSAEAWVVQAASLVVWELVLAEVYWAVGMTLQGLVKESDCNIQGLLLPLGVGWVT